MKWHQRTKILTWLHDKLEPLYTIAKDNKLEQMFHDIYDIEVGMNHRLSDVVVDDTPPYSAQGREISRQNIFITDEKGANISFAEPPAMRAASYEPHTPVIVTWEDAKADVGGDHATVPAALASYKPCIRKTIGFWVGYATEDGRKALLIAADDDRAIDSSFSSIVTIPWGMVTSIEVLRDA